MKKKVIYIDLDGVLADFKTGLKETKQIFKDLDLTNIKPEDNIRFNQLKPMPGAKAAYKKLDKKYDVFIASTAPWDQPAAWEHKRLWVAKHFPAAYKRLILTHRKDLLKGDYIIDDRKVNGVENFDGKHIHFGSKKYPDWNAVISDLKA